MFLPEEKERLEFICNAMHITKIEFLRIAINPELYGVDEKKQRTGYIT